MKAGVHQIFENFSEYCVDKREASD